MVSHSKSLKRKKYRKPTDAEVAALDKVLGCYRKCLDLKTPPGGWVRAIREALGITNVQLAARLSRVPQSIEDMQKSEVAGSIKLQSLRALGEALDCQLVYALVPAKSLAKMRDGQAQAVASRVVADLYGLGKLGAAGRVRELERLIEKVLIGNQKLSGK